MKFQEKLRRQLSLARRGEMETENGKACVAHEGVEIRYKTENCPLCTSSKNWKHLVEAGQEIGIAFVQAALVLGTRLQLAGPSDSPIMLNLVATAQGKMDWLRNQLQSTSGVKPAESRIVLPRTVA
jgi:hypothetical protein